MDEIVFREPDIYLNLSDNCLHWDATLIAKGYERCTSMEKRQQCKLKRRRQHVPHSQRSIESVQRRNERERRRVNDVNSAFKELSKHIPFMVDNRKKISKINILRSAITYIEYLSILLKGNYELLDQQKYNANHCYQGLKVQEYSYNVLCDLCL